MGTTACTAEAVATIAASYRLPERAAELRDEFYVRGGYDSLIGELERNAPAAKFWSDDDGGARAIARIAVRGFRAGEISPGRIVAIVA